ncbi:MAG: AMP-binding protein [Deltaproteobacteria bacterium]|nr:AMP-binding protein [Deltaproteobacteria bacterium]
MMDHAGSKALIYDTMFSEAASMVKKELTNVTTIIGFGDNIPDYALSYEELVEKSANGEPNEEIDEENAYYMNLTSGTTGLPKSYFLTHYNNAGGIIDVTTMFRVTKDDVILTVFPMFGRVGYAWSAAEIYNGAKNVIVNFDPKIVLELISSEKVTISNWVPAMANFILSIPELETYDMSSLRALVFAGAVFPSAMQTAVKEHLCPNIYEFYGLQETGMIINADLDDKEKSQGSIGKTSPWADVRIIDAFGNDVPSGTVGEIIARALSATSAYFKNEEQTKETFKDGWVYTGDLGYVDEEGYIFLSGRTKDMIVTGGQNVFSVEVENVLMTHPSVADCSVIGLPDDTWGEAVTAVIVRNPEEKISEGEIIAYYKGKIAGFKVPKRIIWMEGKLPRTPTGKVQKYMLVEEFTT